MMLLAALVLAQAPSTAAPLDVRWLPELGLVTLTVEGSRLQVQLEKDGAKTAHPFDVSGLSPEGRITEARCGPWLGQEMVVVLAIQHGETTEYRYALSAFRVPGGVGLGLSGSNNFVDRDRLWFLANPLFTSTGDPFRIVSVNDHNQGSDSLEITFRRGWIRRQEEAAKIEEKILFDSCGGYVEEPLLNNRAVLLERGGSPR